jgi:phosphatidylethanolamine-binding protein (PEBP) family uncharacterized protein
MSSMRSVVLAAVLAYGMAAWAHPPDPDNAHDDGHHVHAADMRTWTNTRTGAVVRGAFLSARRVEGAMRVSIEQESGDVVVLAFDDLAASDQVEAARRIDGVRAVHAADVRLAAHREEPKGVPAQADPFDAFAPFVTTRWDERWLYIESDGLPHVPGGTQGTYVFSHTPMVGITAWQQQVPLPQNYRGANAWRIPLKPELADKPVSTKEQLFRGAIALAANGVPIFNPIKNDGRTDTFLAGELDEFGGHCGRADDYHYHIAPTHLQKFVGDHAPIAYALDGFAIYGHFDPAANPGELKSCSLGSREKLDDLNGHFAPARGGSSGGVRGLYHYHASERYPYLNGGMRGVVMVKSDQIDPQPRAESPRAALPPLRGAKITGFKATGEADEPAWSLEYLQNGRKSFVNYRLEGEGKGAKYVFDFVDPEGATRTDVYESAATQRRPGGGGRGAGGGRRDGGGDQPQNEPAGEPRDAPPPQNSVPEREPGAAQDVAAFTVTSTDVKDGRLSIECTCDGASRSPALSWKDAPRGTKAFAVAMHHVPPDGSTHVYMVVANIPGGVRELKGGDASVGTWGQNTVNRRGGYAPPCSQGPGDKSYTITVYALSSEAKLAPGAALTRDELLAAVQKITLASAAMDVTYARARGGEKPGDRDMRPPNERRRGPERRVEGGAGPADDGRGLMERMTAFKTDVPAHEVSVILARPTERSMTVSIAVAVDSDAIVEYWVDGSAARERSDAIGVKSGPAMSQSVELSGLQPGTAYRYRVGLTPSGSPSIQWQPESGFRTRPASGTAFTFAIQADSHLDQGVEPRVYEQTLANMLAGEPDFVIDLGDTFMTDKRVGDFRTAAAQYDAQRYYLSRVAHGAALFMVLGNHDGEKGTSGRDGEDIGPWSYRQRTSRFPTPIVDGSMYSGATGLREGVGSNYYAFEWGDALFVVLDPFWSTGERVRGGGGGTRGGGGGASDPARPNDEPLKPTDASWVMTLGRAQYDWLATTLAASKAAYRFVFTHHLVGGMGGAESRGGAESSKYFEWGGANADGTNGFRSRRADWAMPIHDLLVKHGVSIVFHGHDHLYVRGERDGVVYQCVPQPGNPAGNTRSATQYGYASGVVRGSPGHVRVRVGPQKTRVEFVRTAVAGIEAGRGRGQKGEEAVNGAIVEAYDIAPRTPTR